MGSSQGKSANDAASKGNELANIYIGSAEDQGGDSELVRRGKKIRAANDYRAAAVDVEDMSKIFKRFPIEFSVAEEKIVNKKKSDQVLAPYVGDRIKDADPHYLRWLKEYKASKDLVKKHPYDELLEDKRLLLTNISRITTSLGGLYGMCRTFHLYRTMDKTYAKLHGVSLTSIGVYEISKGILCGVGLGLGVACALHAGDSVSCMLTSWLWNDVTVKQRQWYSLAFSGASVGLLCGGSLVFVRRHFLTAKGFIVLFSLPTLLGTAAGFAFGHYSYKPHAASRREGPAASSEPWFAQNFDNKVSYEYFRSR